MKFAAIFTDNAILQRRKPVSIFGTGTPFQSIRVSIPERDISVETRVLADGTWTAVLPPQESGNSATLIAEAEGGRAICRNVQFGEVWLCGGQSNMELMLKDAKGGAEELSLLDASSPVRAFCVPRETFPGNDYDTAWAAASWKTAGPEASAGWSAVGYFAAKELAQALACPVGIIGCNFGGSSITCWLPNDDLTATSAGRAYLDDYTAATSGKTDAQMIAEYDEYTAYHAVWSEKMQRCYDEDPAIPWEEIIRRCGENRYPGPMGVKNPLRPSGMYEKMLSPIAPYTLAGIFYYQGESDDHRPDTYETLLAQLLYRLRHDFADASLPVILVQLPMFAYFDTPENESWSKIRAAQLHISQMYRNVGLAVALDCGEFGNIHPTEKRVVAHRVAVQAESICYHVAEKEAEVPVFSKKRIDPSGITIYFSNTTNGLEFRGPISGFEIAADDENFVPALAELDADTLFLHSDAVKSPIFARYAWRNFGDICLYDKNGTPVPPFRA